METPRHWGSGSKLYAKLLTFHFSGCPLVWETKQPLATGQKNRRFSPLPWNKCWPGKVHLNGLEYSSQTSDRIDRFSRSNIHNGFTFGPPFLTFANRKKENYCLFSLSKLAIAFFFGSIRSLLVEFISIWITWFIIWLSLWGRWYLEQPFSGRLLSASSYLAHIALFLLLPFAR